MQENSNKKFFLYKDEIQELWKHLLAGQQNGGAVVINLRERKDREALAQNSAKNMGLSIEFYYAERHKINGTMGCFESHQNVCREALKNGKKRLLVLEDDFCPTDELFSKDGVAALREIVEFANSTNDWNIIYLGVMPNVWSESTAPIGKHLYKMRPWSCTHAMILNEAYMKEIVSWKFSSFVKKDAYDWRHRKCEKAYTVHPQLIKQSESPSDIRNFQIPVPNSLKFLRDAPIKLVSWYARYVKTSILTITLISLLILSVKVLFANQKPHMLKFAEKLAPKTIEITNHSI
jgi:hypothetical protein